MFNLVCGVHIFKDHSIGVLIRLQYFITDGFETQYLRIYSSISIKLKTIMNCTITGKFI